MAAEKKRAASKLVSFHDVLCSASLTSKPRFKVEVSFVIKKQWPPPARG